jgi:prepilin-type N-terminal cleavage/methylation domain-containing protein
MKNFLKLKSKQRGFTLIELLVVIAIISLLSSVILAALQDVRKKAQYAKFDQEFLQLKTAIELYRSDHGGQYPESVKTFSSDIDLIIELNQSNYYPVNEISLPNGYADLTESFVYASNSNTPNIEALSGNVMTCGSPTQSDTGSNYTVYFYTTLSSGTSKLPKAYNNGTLLYLPNVKYHCFEI